MVSFISTAIVSRETENREYLLSSCKLSTPVRRLRVEVQWSTGSSQSYGPLANGVGKNGRCGGARGERVGCVVGQTHEGSRITMYILKLGEWMDVSGLMEGKLVCY